MHDPLRPTFERTVPNLDSEALTSRIAAALAHEEHGLPHRRAGQHFLVWLPSEMRHMWSPWLHLDVTLDDDKPDSAALFGRFTPAPNVWTAVMFSYLALGVLALGGGLFGYSQWLVAEHPWGLWFIPATAVIALLILLISRAGQTLAREQMGHLVEVIERALPKS